MEGNGIPLSGIISPANRHDQTLALPTLDAIRIGGRRRKPKRLGADKGYDAYGLRKALRMRGIKSAISHREYAHRRQRSLFWDDGRNLRYCRQRWKVERSFAWLDHNRRLGYCYEKTTLSYRALFSLAMIRFYLKRLYPRRY